MPVFGMGVRREANLVTRYELQLCLLASFTVPSHRNHRRFSARNEVFYFAIVRSSVLACSTCL